MSADERPLIVFGAGGHAAVVVDIALKTYPNRQLHVFDDAADCAPVLGCTVTSGLPDTVKFPPSQYKVVVGIGSNSARKLVSGKLHALGYEFETLIHPHASIGTQAEVGKGVVVCAQAVVNPRAKLSDGCIVNTGAVIEHDCVIGPFCHVGPGAVVAGEAKLGAVTWICANAVVKETTVIGANVIVGAGSFVNSDLDANATYVGSPVRRII